MAVRVINLQIISGTDRGSSGKHNEVQSPAVFGRWLSVISVSSCEKYFCFHVSANQLETRHRPSLGSYGPGGPTSYGFQRRCFGKEPSLLSPFPPVKIFLPPFCCLHQFFLPCRSFPRCLRFSALFALLSVNFTHFREDFANAVFSSFPGVRCSMFLLSWHLPSSIRYLPSSLVAAPPRCVLCG